MRQPGCRLGTEEEEEEERRERLIRVRDRRERDEERESCRVASTFLKINVYFVGNTKPGLYSILVKFLFPTLVSYISFSSSSAAAAAAAHTSNSEEYADTAPGLPSRRDTSGVTNSFLVARRDTVWKSLNLNIK